MGFSARTADQEAQPWGLRFVAAGLGGTRLRVWNYLLRELDPHRDRYGAIVLVVRDYDEAIAFYTKKLGFTLVADTYQPEQDKRWVVVAPQ